MYFLSKYFIFQKGVNNSFIRNALNFLNISKIIECIHSIKNISKAYASNKEFS